MILIIFDSRLSLWIQDIFIRFIDMTSMWYFIIISAVVMVVLTVVIWCLL